MTRKLDFILDNCFYKFKDKMTISIKL